MGLNGKWCEKTPREISEEASFYRKRDDLRIVLFGGSSLDKLRMYSSIVKNDFMVPVSFRRSNYSRREGDYTIDLDQIKLLPNISHRLFEKFRPFCPEPLAILLEGHLKYS